MKKVLTLFLVFFAFHTFGTVINGPGDVHSLCMNSHAPSFPGVLPMSYEQCVASTSTIVPPTQVAGQGGGRAPAVVNFNGIQDPRMIAPERYYVPPTYGQIQSPHYVNPTPLTPFVVNDSRNFMHLQNSMNSSDRPFILRQDLRAIPN